MSAPAASVLVSYLGAGDSLSADEHALLAGFESRTLEYARGAKVHDQGEVLDSLYIVRDGWLRLDNELLDGRRHIVRTFQRGDVIGLHDLAESRSLTALVACTDAVICPFPRRILAELAIAAPRIVSLLLALSARDQAVLSDLLRITGRLSARERVAYLLLVYLHRARASDASLVDTFPLGLDQSQTGDMIGLTNVSVSKAFVSLESEGLITRHRQFVTLSDIPRLSRGIGFVNRFTPIDVSWFPTSSAAANLSA